MKDKLCIFLALAASACGGSDEDKVNDTTPIRRGETLPTSTDGQFMAAMDRSSEVSADGKTAVFLSFRAGDHTKAQLYKQNLDKPEETPTSVVSNADLGTVLEYAISPDAKWLAFTTVTDKGTALYVQNLQDATVAAQRLDDAAAPGFESSLALSTGAQPFLAYQQTLNSSTQLFLSQLTGGNTWAAPVALTEAGNQESLPRWFKDDAVARLLTTRQGSASATQVDLVIRDISALDQAKAVTPAVWRQGLTRGLAGALVTTKDKIASVTILPRSPAKLVEIATDKTEVPAEQRRKILVQSEANVLPASGDAVTLTSQQSSVQAVSANQDASLLLSFGYEEFDCKKQFESGRTMVLHNVNTQKSIRLDLRSNAAGNGWDLVTEACQYVITGTQEGTYNRQISQARLASQSQLGQVTIVFDIMDGKDMEVYAMTFAWDGDKTISGAKVWDVSRNKL